ncbi:TldD/PmbA family protein [Acholeplasma sp. OttesenSCG-928-E16]|nr:TldD/PmbA family protein [Acholeplasma sp. OttesenSCG-928-E16]
MIGKEKLQELLALGVSTGADFAEIFLEDSANRSMNSIGGQIIASKTSNVFGAGIRLLQGGDEVYGYTNDVSFDNLKKLILDLASSYSGPKGVLEPLKDAKPYKVIAKKFGAKAKAKVKADKLMKLSSLIKDYDPKIVQAVANLIEYEQKVLIVNSLGVYQDDLRVRTRVILAAYAQDEKGMVEVFEGPGQSMGIELFDKIDLEALALDVAKRAIDALSAADIVSQKMPVVLHNAFGGVIFHEACGHPLEATSVAKGLSPFANRIGDKVGSDILSARDNGTLKGEWGWQNFDDEGSPTKDNLLIENGVLKGYLIDYRNSRKMNMEPTGSSRRQSYKYSPTSRMSSTYITNGTDTLEAIIKDTKYGLFAKKLGGGQVNPATGEFNFAVSEGYMIEDGKLTKQVRGAMLIGQGKDILYKIDRIASNLELGQGMCGSLSGSIPVDVGQPSIRVTELTVGGGGKE